VHGQSALFRVVKYLILLGIVITLYNLYGQRVVLYFLITGSIIGITAHLFFRWKTNGWRKSWGLYKKI
jgi:hypothetical protein